MTENTKPTVAELIAAIKEHNDLEVTPEEITEEIYESATKGYERGVSLKSMANRVRFYLAGSNKEDVEKETVDVTGVFVGSKDIATENKPLGKNKAQTISFLQQCDDGYFRVFGEPNTPSHFKGFKKKNFGALVESEFNFTKNSKGTFVTPEKVNVLDKGFELDTGNIKAYEISALPELENFTPCAVYGTLSSIKPLRVPPWEQDKYEDEDYPLVINKNPVFTVFLQADAEEGEPIVKGSVNPTHLSKPYITLDDFDAIWPLPEDLKDIDADDFLQDEITAMYNGVEVILIGQKKRATEYDDNIFVDIDVTAIIPVGNAPSIIEVASGAERAKAAKAKKEAEKKEDADKEKKKWNVRQKKVAETVTAMRDTTTVQMVRDMVAAKYFKGVPDEKIQELIDKEFKKQGIEVSEETETEATDDSAEDDDVWD